MSQALSLGARPRSRDRRRPERPSPLWLWSAWS